MQVKYPDIYFSSLGKFINFVVSIINNGCKHPFSV